MSTQPRSPGQNRNVNGKPLPSANATAPRQVGRPSRTAGPKIDLCQAYKLRVINRLSYKEIARTLGVAKSSVHAALTRLNQVMPDPEQVQAFEEVEPFILTSVKMKLLASLTDEECIKKASLNNRGFAFTQVANHERLVKGQSTGNIGLLTKAILLSDKQIPGPLQDKQEEW